MLQCTPSTHRWYRRCCWDVWSSQGPTQQCCINSRLHPSPGEVHLLLSIAKWNCHAVYYRTNDLANNTDRHHRTYYWWHHEDAYSHYRIWYIWTDPPNPRTVDQYPHSATVYGCDPKTCRIHSSNQKDWWCIHQSGCILLSWRMWP